MKKHLKINPALSRMASLFTAVLVSALMTGCAGINRLREAQDSFNQAATAENAARLDANPADATASLASVRASYASALLSLGKISSKDEQSLRSDGLWGTALTLKALCQWRVGQYEQAMSNAALAQASAGDQLYPRDKALLTALPGLIKTDQAYAKIFNSAPMQDIEELLIGTRGAVHDLQNARATADAKHPVQAYLIQAQLAAYRNYTVALDRLSQHATVPVDSPARANAISQLGDLNALIKLQKSGPSSQDIVVYWAKVCGLPPPAP